MMNTKQPVPKKAPKAEAKSESVVRTVDLQLIELDKTLQCRKFIDKKIVEEYSALIAEKVAMPPLKVVAVAGRLLLVDGFTRHAAYILAGKTKCQIDVCKGSYLDAVAEACGANKTHGLRRTAEDIQRAVDLAEKSFPDLSPTDVANMVGISRSSAYKYSTSPKKPVPKKPEKEDKSEKSEKEQEPKETKSTKAEQEPKADKEQKAKKPIHHEPDGKPEVIETESCKICGGNEYELTDGGHQCVKCLHLLDEKPTEEAVVVGKAVQAALKHKEVHTAFGRLVREIEKAGLMGKLEEDLKSFALKLGNI